MPKMLDLFCGTKSMANAFKRAGWETYTVDWEEKFEPTLCCDVNILTVDKIIEPVIVEDFYQSREPRVYAEVAPTLGSERAGLKVTDKVEYPCSTIRWRIRKLTPLDCWRLMGFTDEDHNRAAKYTSASARYKMAGNSIVVECLIAIFSSLFLEDGYKAGVWTKQHIEGCENRTIPLYDKKMSLREKTLW